jgi:hypothetical protein
VPPRYFVDDAYAKYSDPTSMRIPGDRNQLVDLLSVGRYDVEASRSSLAYKHRPVQFALVNLLVDEDTPVDTVFMDTYLHGEKDAFSQVPDCGVSTAQVSWWRALLELHELREWEEKLNAWHEDVEAKKMKRAELRRTGRVTLGLDKQLLEELKYKPVPLPSDERIRFAKDYRQKIAWYLLVPDDFTDKTLMNKVNVFLGQRATFMPVYRCKILGQPKDEPVQKPSGPLSWLFGQKKAPAAKPAPPLVAYILKDNAAETIARAIYNGLEPRGDGQAKKEDTVLLDIRSARTKRMDGPPAPFDQEKMREKLKSQRGNTNLLYALEKLASKGKVGPSLETGSAGS